MRKWQLSFFAQLLMCSALY